MRSNRSAYAYQSYMCQIAWDCASLFHFTMRLLNNQLRDKWQKEARGGLSTTNRMHTQHNALFDCTRAIIGNKNALSDPPPFPTKHGIK